MENVSNRLGSISLAPQRRRTAHAFHELNASDTSVALDPHFDPNSAASSVGLMAPSQQLVSPALSGSTSTFEPNTHRANSTPQLTQMPLAEPAADAHVLQATKVSEELSVAKLRNDANHKYLSTQFLSFEHVSPPLAGTSYQAVDQYNATPKFARMSMYSLPYNEELKQKSKLPLGMELRPFADAVVEEERDEPVPQIDVTNVEFVPRCARCRAYLNPGMKTTERHMSCNICGFKTQLPSEYFSTLDYQGNREDYQSRSELSKGVVDYIVPNEYNWNEEETSSPLNRVFLIDVSFEAYKTKVTEAMCNAIKSSLYDDMGQNSLPAGSKVAIIGYDSLLHFYDLSPTLEQASISMVTDLEEPFLPFIDGLFVDPIESEQIIDITLMSIEQHVKQSRSGVAFGAALKAAELALTEFSGGQIIASLSQLPQHAPGNLKLKLLETDEREWIKSICTANDKYYLGLQKSFIENNISLNLFVASQNSVDLGNLGSLAVKTGGVLREWIYFNINRDEVTFIYAIKECFDSIAGYQCQLKVRCSRGLVVLKYYGGFNTVTDGSLAVNIPTVGANTSVICEFGYNSSLDTKTDAHFQSAFLYTAKDGARKVRVINSIISITQRLNDVFTFSDQDTIVKLFLRESLDAFTSGSLVALKNSLLMKVADINAAYRSFVSNQNVSTDSLILPANLRTLPMMLLSIWKSKAFGSKVNVPDIRLASYFNLMNFNSAKLSVFLYPMLVCLHALEPEDCSTNGLGLFQLPKTLPATLNGLEFGGAYLMFNGQKLMIWLHKDVNPMLLRDLFGETCEALDDVEPFVSQLPHLDTVISVQVRSLCRYLSRHYSNYENMSVEVVRFGKDQSEVEFQQMFVESRNSSLDPSYADFLKTLHSDIEKKVSGASTNGNSSGRSHSLANDDGVGISSRFGF